MKTVEGPAGIYYVHEDAEIAATAIIGAESKIWGGAKIYNNVVIGRNAVIGAGVHIETGVVLGDGCKVQRGVTLYSGVECGDYCFFGPNATTTNDRNPRAFGDWLKSTTIFETGSSVGANATIVAGTRIGALSLIGAGSVVTKDTLPFELVGGNPARHMGWVDVNGAVISKDIEAPDLITSYHDIDARQLIESYLTGEPNAENRN